MTGKRSRSRSGQRRASRKTGNSLRLRRGNPVTLRQPALPPTLDIQSNMITLWLRTSIVIDNVSSFALNGGSQYIFDEHAALTVAFGQYRLRRAHFWYIPYAGYNTIGGYAALVVDDNTVIGTNASGYSQIISCPGSVMRKSFQSCALAWRITEPEDREWRITTSNTYTSFVIRMATSQIDAADLLRGRIVCDFQVQLRGYNTADTASQRACELFSLAPRVPVVSFAPPESVDSDDFVSITSEH